MTPPGLNSCCTFRLPPPRSLHLPAACPWLDVFTVARRQGPEFRPRSNAASLHMDRTPEIQGELQKYLFSYERTSFFVLLLFLSFAKWYGFLELWTPDDIFAMFPSGVDPNDMILFQLGSHRSTSYIHFQLHNNLKKQFCNFSDESNYDRIGRAVVTLCIPKISKVHSLFSFFYIGDASPFWILHLLKVCNSTYDVHRWLIT